MVVGGLMAVVILSAQVASGVILNGDHEPTATHYPDLRTRQLTLGNLQVNVKTSRNPKRPPRTIELRFPNTVANWGTGPLEVRPEHDTNARTTTAYQRLFTHDSAGNPSLADEQPVGNFVFHKQHHHWHFEGFALYELYYDADGGLGNLVMDGAKTTVCIRDNSTPESGTSGLVHFGWGGYHNCSKTSVQGLTVGYGDTYTAGTQGQSFDITAVSFPACLWLVSTANPDNLLHESLNDNNTTAIRFQVTADYQITGC